MRLKIVHCCFTVALALSLSVGCAHAQYPGFDAGGGRGASGGGLASVESVVDGGSIPIGATAQVVVLFRNEGTQPVQTGRINLYPSSNVSSQVSLNQCEVEALPPGADCAVALSVKGLQSGPWRVEMLMLHNGRSRLVTSTLSGTVDAGSGTSDKLSSDIETIPDEIDFGSLGSSQTMVEPVILRNITSNPITISDIMINASDRSGYSLDAECDELAAGQACIATITWAPRQKGPSTGVLVVKHSGPTGLSSVSLSGDYAPDEIEEAEIFPQAIPGRGLLVSSQSELDFGSGVLSASTITVSLVNTGDVPLTLKDIKISGADSGVSVSSGGCVKDMMLEPIEACPLTLTWSPTRIGAVLNDVQVLHDGARGVLVLPIRGTADAVVSQDQKAIVLSDKKPTRVIGNQDVTDSSRSSAHASDSAVNVTNAASALDGLKITSFSSKRAIVNGPGGSRLVFNNEEIMLGGVLWGVKMQANGIEFLNGDNRVLLLFDKSLSSVNRVSSQSAEGSSSSNEVVRN